MREYALTRAQSLNEVKGGFSLPRIFCHWKTRRRIAHLESCNDFMLSDIGVTRDEVQWAARLPLSINAALALEDRALRRRKSLPVPTRTGWGAY